MARLTKKIIINNENSRDNGKVFLLTEPSAFKGERLFNSFFALCGDEITPENIMGKVSDDEGVKLWDSLIELVQIMPSPDKSDITRKIDDQDIEEIATILKLKGEALSMILGFMES